MSLESPMLVTGTAIIVMVFMVIMAPMIHGKDVVENGSDECCHHIMALFLML